MVTTSFGQSIRRNQHCINLRSHLGSAVSFVLNQLQKYDIFRIQSVVRKVYDEDTGRTRLVKGDGEILEECVSASRHEEINKQATEGDGQSFQV